MTALAATPPSGSARLPLQLNELLRQVNALPALPAAVTELMRCLEDPSIDIDSVAAKIARDQGLTARVLRVANSPFYGLSRSVASISDAMVILGVRSVRMLVTTAAVANTVRPVTASGFDLKDFWWHSLAAALAARALARRCGVDGETAFLAGLLHDCGKLAIAYVAPDAYRGLLAECATRGRPMLEVEAECLGLTHAEVGAALAQHWRFAPHVTAAVGAHHDPAPVGALQAVAVFSDALAHSAEGEPSPQVPEPLAPLLRLDPIAIEACLEEMRSGQAAAAAIIGQ